MPRVTKTRNTIQRAYVPLISHARFKPERLSACLEPLPWRITYPPHGLGIIPPEKSVTASTADSTASSTAPTIKIPRPSGEPGRPGDQGFSVKDSLKLPDGVYDELLVSYTRYKLGTFFERVSQIAVNTTATKHLDLSKGISKQSLTSLSVVFTEVRISW